MKQQYSNFKKLTEFLNTQNRPHDVLSFCVSVIQKEMKGEKTNGQKGNLKTKTKRA